MTVGLVVDGGASIPEECWPSPLAWVPMHLEPGADGEATTAAPSPGEFLQAITEADDGDGVVVVTVASRLSASFAAAAAAIQLVGQEHEVALVDSESATAGQGLVALAAARAAAAGRPLKAVADAAQEAAARVRLVAQIERLDRLARGGRLPASLATATRLTGLRPIFSLAKGQIRPLRPAFSLAAAEYRILAAWRRSERRDAWLHVAAIHAGAQDSAERLLARLGAFCRPSTSFVTELSPVMLEHTGVGVSGLCWWWEEQAT